MSKEKIEYWYPSDYKMLSIVEEEIIRLTMGGYKTRYSVHHYSCSKQKFPKLEVGETYWVDVSESLMSHSLYKKCTITCIRSGVVFYLEEGKSEENWFSEGSLQHGFTAPLEITVDLDPEFYEVIDHSGLMKVNYIGKLC